MLELVIKGKNLRELHSEVLKVADEVKTKFPENVVTSNAIPQIINEETDDVDTGDNTQVNSWKEMPGQPGAYHNPELNSQVQNGQFIPPKQQTQATSVGGVELDRDGVPWDKRIHSAERTKTNKGTWRIRRNLDKDLVVQVTKELMQRQDDLASNAQAQPSPAVPQVPQQNMMPQQSAVLHVVPPVQNFAPQAQAAQVPQQPIQPVQQPQQQQAAYAPMTVPPGTKPAHSYQTFKAQFAMVIQNLLAEKKITIEYLAQLKAHYQVGDIWEVAADDAKCQSLFDTLVQYGLITRV